MRDTEFFQVGVIKTLSSMYHVPTADAETMVHNSPLPTMLEEFPTDTLHETWESWAEEIFEQYQY